MENANLTRSLNRTFYRLSQKYGVQGSISKRTAATTDFATGKTKQTIESASIRKLVRVAVAGDARNVLYTAAMMQSLRPFAWQGGAGQTVKHAVFLIYKNELRDWGDITPSQWIRWDNRNWQVAEVLVNEGGWIIEAKLAEGQEDGVVVTVEHDLGVTDSGVDELGPTGGIVNMVVSQSAGVTDSPGGSFTSPASGGIGALIIETDFTVA